MNREAAVKLLLEYGKRRIAALLRRQLERVARRGEREAR